MNASKGLFGMLLVPTLFTAKTAKAATPECRSAEEEAEELQKLLAQEGSPQDPEEYQEMLMKARGSVNRKPPQFMRLTVPLKMYSMFRPNDGFQFGAGIPFSQRFQATCSWIFSNKKPGELEIMTMLTGGGNMMDEDSISYINANSSASGRLALQGQLPLWQGVKLSGEVDMGGPDPQMSMASFSLQKDFRDSHLQYSYQPGPLHMLSYMQSTTKDLTLGFQMGYLPPRNAFLWSYGGKYELGKNTLIASLSPMNPQEKLLIGIVGKPARRLQLFAELKANQTNATDMLAGFRAKFQEGMVTGTMSTSGKATSVYKHQIEFLEVSLVTTMDFSNPRLPISFGMGLNLGGGM